MILEEISYSVDDWNLDGLSIAAPRLAYLPGAKSLVPLTPDLGPAIGLTYQGRTFANLLRPAAKLLETVDLNTGAKVLIELKELGTPIDMAPSATSSAVYILDLDSNSVVRFQQGRVRATWPLALTLSDRARIVVTTGANGDLLFVGPSRDGRMLAIHPWASPLRSITFLPLAERTTAINVEPGSQFCCDTSNKTLLISDQPRHRILEVNIADLAAPAETASEEFSKVIQVYDRHYGNAGTGQGVGGLNIEAPTAILIYRPEGFPLKAFLSLQSRKLMGSVFPRTILVADSRTLRIQRIIEYSHISGFPQRVCPLLGSGSTPQDQHQEIRTAPDGDMRQWAIQSPEGMALSEVGELCILLKDEFLLILTPFSARRENIDHVQSNEDRDEGTPWIS